MITSLRIENFALIDKVDIQFHQGFTVITGETGSGKSIVLNALNLILGERANFSVIGELKDKSSVEAEIDISNFGLKEFFENNELDYFDQCIVRREISKQGRSRAFINDTPVQLTTLKEFSGNLIHIHSQYNTLELKDPRFQLNVLDILAGTVEKSKEVSELHSSLQVKLRRRNSLMEALADAVKVSDYNDFQLKELSALNLHDQDYEELQGELTMNANADELKAIYQELKEALSGGQGMVNLLEELNALVAKKTGISETLKSMHQRIESAILELKDIGDEAEGKLESVDSDPARLMELSNQMDKYNDALFKHKLNSQEELVQLMEELESSARGTGEIEAEVETLTVEIDQLQGTLSKRADELHAQRVTSAPSIENSIQATLEELKLSNTQLKFDLSKSEEISSTGNSVLEILFSPNAGVAPVPVNKAASGGELSRVMLALQSLMSAKTQLRTILFDEIDTGVSGDVAQKVGATLSKMGEGMQVIAITHLPQVAAKGSHHLKVTKSEKDGRTMSAVHVLSVDERVEETARLMSGDEINQAALENAKALMK